MSDRNGLTDEIAPLANARIDQVRERWRERFKTAPPAHRSKDLLVRVFAYELQARAQGRPGRQSQRRLEALANRFAKDRKFTPEGAPALKPGTVLVREWHGRRYAVTATDDGFLLDGKAYPTLSAVAFGIAGVKWSGPRFFRETRNERARP